jgi:nitrous oxidase accessory protein
MKFFVAFILSLLLGGAASIEMEFLMGSAVSGLIRVPADYPTIQEAIDAAIPGDRILVANGTYHEHLNVYKGLTLVGEDPVTTIIDGDGVGIVVNINAKVELCNFTIRDGGVGSPSASGIHLSHSGCFVHHNIITNNGWYGVYVQESSFNTLSENIIANNGRDGIELVYSHNNMLCANSLRAGDIGIWLYESNNNKIHRNTIINPSRSGVEICESSNNVVSDNSFNGGHYGVILQGGSQNNIIGRGNSMTNCAVGVGLWDFTTNTTVCGNTICTGGGVVLLFSDDNLIKDNTICYQNIGIYFEQSYNNTLYHNNFIDNAVQADAYWSSDNVWDNGFEGNYWSDYNGTDADQDGIGDTPYSIDVDDIDYYPLMNPSPIRHVAYAPPLLNLLKKQGGWLTCHIELLSGHHPEEISISSIRLEGVVPIDLNGGIEIGDYDSDGIPDLTVRFDKTLVQNCLNRRLPPIENRIFQTTKIKVTITGKLHDNTSFQGTNTITICRFRTKPTYPL